jgi:hypothetical protein
MNLLAAALPAYRLSFRFPLPTHFPTLLIAVGSQPVSTVRAACVLASLQGIGPWTIGADFQRATSPIIFQ